MKKLLAAVAIVGVTIGVGVTAPAADAPSNHHAVLSGGSEVPENDSRSRGVATFRVSADGSEIESRLVVANLDDVMQAHIHLAPAGSNGGVVVWLYPEGPPAQLIPGRSAGVLSTGTITADDLVGSLAGMSLDALLDAIESGGAYVNVHTSAFPGGEIRGQIH
jgi:hypothetical protein